MARSPLTLAALVAASLPDFDPVKTQPLSTGQHGEYDSARVANADGRSLVIRIANSDLAASDISAQVHALGAMSAGVRSRLPFEVPSVVATIAQKENVGAVFNYIDGNIISVTDFDKNIGLATVIGRAIARIHQVPTGFAVEAGLPSFTTNETQRQAHELVTRARETGLLPAALAERWLEAVEDATLWQFEPALVHGSLGADRFLIGAEDITGVLGWGATRVGDPAWDLHWAVSLGLDMQSELFASYDDVRLSASDPKVRQRAVLYSELELVRWLLHGRELGRQDIIDDAIAMMDRLIDTVRDEGVNTVGQQTAPILSLVEVETLLETVPEVPADEVTAEIPAFSDAPQVEAPIVEAPIVAAPIDEPALEIIEVEITESIVYESLSPNDTETVPNPVHESEPDDDTRPTQAYDV